jgi:excisionase family DNA binding protein
VQEVDVTTLGNPRHSDEPLRSGVSLHREWLSYAEASELVGLGRTTLWKLAGAGEIEVARVGRARRISRESLTAYMKRSAGDGAAAAE